MARNVPSGKDDCRISYKVLHSGTGCWMFNLQNEDLGSKFVEHHVPLGGGCDQPRLIRAAEYVRMSTEHQQYSISNQQQAIRYFAKSHGMEVVRTYVDAGKSGVTIARRPALKTLIEEARAGNLDVENILVYDVTRWGRFQDPDESAFYEFLCKSAGYGVVYCAEPFSPNPAPLASALKGLKRVMAGEFSRELSVKKYAGQVRFVSQGIWLGDPGYGFRRAVIDRTTGRPRLILQPGQQKNLKSDLTTLVLGPKHEVNAVRAVFRMFVEERCSRAEIARVMNRRSVPAYRGRAWSDQFVWKILKRERYAGHLVWGKRATQLGVSRGPRPPDQWIRVNNAFPPIISETLFERARELLQNPQPDRKLELLAGLERLKQRHLRFTSELIDAAKDIPSFGTYRRHFGGGIARLRALVGAAEPIYPRQLDRREVALHERHKLQAEIIRRFEERGIPVVVDPAHKRLIVDGMIIGLSVLVGHKRPDGRCLWLFTRFRDPKPNVTVIARIHPRADRVLDYHVVPASALLDHRYIALGQTGSLLERYRRWTLDGFEEMLSAGPTQFFDADAL